MSRLNIKLTERTNLKNNNSSNENISCNNLAQSLNMNNFNFDGIEEVKEEEENEEEEFSEANFIFESNNISKSLINSLFAFKKATNDYAVAFGNSCEASGLGSFAAGQASKATSNSSSAFGRSAEANGLYSFAAGYGVKASGNSQAVVGQFNSTSTAGLFIVGCGTSNTNRRDAFFVSSSTVTMFSSSNTGTVYVNGSSVHSSDRRLKQHESYLSDDACDFVRKLKPALFTRDGAKHYGFYAQDVQEVDEHGTATVTEGDYDGYKIEDTGLTINGAGTYVVSGSCADGSIKAVLAASLANLRYFSCASA